MTAVCSINILATLRPWWPTVCHAPNPIVFFLLHPRGCNKSWWSYNRSSSKSSNSCNLSRDNQSPGHPGWGDLFAAWNLWWPNCESQERPTNMPMIAQILCIRLLQQVTSDSGCKLEIGRNAGMEFLVIVGWDYVFTRGSRKKASFANCYWVGGTVYTYFYMVRLEMVYYWWDGWEWIGQV